MPFLTNTPAHIPQTKPKESSYVFTRDTGGGGKGSFCGAGGGATGLAAVTPMFIVNKLMDVTLSMRSYHH